MKYIRTLGLLLALLPSIVSAQTKPSVNANNVNADGNLTIGGTFNGKSIPAGAFVGTTDAQTLTNKNISASQINSGQIDTARLPSIITGSDVSKSGSDLVIGTGTSNNVFVQTNGVNRWTFGPASGNLSPNGDNIIDLGVSSNRIRTFYAAGIGTQSVPVTQTYATTIGDATTPVTSQTMAAGGTLTTPNLQRIGSSLYPSVVAPAVTTATSVSGSAVIVVASNSGIALGQAVFATFADPSSIVTNIAGTSITMSKVANATNAAPVSTQFGQARYSATSAVLANTIGAETIYAGRASKDNFTWLNTIFPGSDYRTLANFTSIVSPGSGGVAGIFANRSSDNNGAFGAGIALNVSTLIDSYNSTNHESWNIYNEANLTSTPGTGIHLNEESSTYSKWAYVATDPYSPNQAGSTRNMRLDCGKGPTGPSPTSCSAAVEIIQNDAKYGKGIVFGSDAVLPFVDSTQPVIVMGKDQAIHWFQANNTPGWALVSTKTTGAEKKLTLGDTSVQIGGNADLDVGGHIFQGAGPPTVTSCGTTPSMLAGSTDTNGIVTEGTTATGCVLTFAKAYTIPPVCVVSSPSGSAFTSYSTSATALTIVNASASGNKYAYICMGG